MTNSYMDTKSSSYEKRARVDLLDLKDQTEGEAHIFFRSKIVRARMFYAAPKPVKRLKLNQFLKVEPPSDDYLVKLQNQLAGFQRIVETGDFTIKHDVFNEEVDLINTIYHDSTVVEPIAKGVAALLAFHRHNEPEKIEELVDEVEVGNLTIFTKLFIPPNAPRLLVTDVAMFSEPLLDINLTRNDMMQIEHLSGEKDKLSGNIANELIKDMQLATSYPPMERDYIGAAELSEMINTLVQIIDAERQRAHENQQDDL